MLKIIWAKS